MYRKKVCMILIIVFILSFVSAKNANLIFEQYEYSVFYSGDSKDIEAKIKNINFLCSINCSWDFYSGDENLNSGNTGKISAGQNASVTLTLNSTGNSPKIFTFSIYCQESGELLCIEEYSTSAYLNLNFGYCGDGKLTSETEECEGNNLGGNTCLSSGFEGGNLVCSNCRLDTSNCYRCGDGVLNIGERCDGSDFGGATCQSLGYTAGALSCSNSCNFDYSDCYECSDNSDCNEGYACFNGECEVDVQGIEDKITGKVSETVSKEVIKGNILGKVLGTLLAGLLLAGARFSWKKWGNKLSKKKGRKRR